MAGRTSRARKQPPGSVGERGAARAEPSFGDVDAAASGAYPHPGGGGNADADGRRRRKPRRAEAEPERDEPERDDPESVARLICLQLLTAAPRTQAELATALRRRGVPDDAAATVLARFAEVKLIDDAMFARAWVESRHHGRGLARRALSAELRRKGVAQDDIASALEELDPDQELTTARELVARRLPATRGQPGPARMRRLAGMLARKGYAPGLAFRVVREALEREAADTGRPAYYLAGVDAPDEDEEPSEFPELGAR